MNCWVNVVCSKLAVVSTTLYDYSCSELAVLYHLLGLFDISKIVLSFSYVADHVISRNLVFSSQLTVKMLIVLLGLSILTIHSESCREWIVINPDGCFSYIHVKIVAGFKFRSTDGLIIIIRRSPLLKPFPAVYYILLPWTKHSVTIIRFRNKALSKKFHRNNPFVENVFALGSGKRHYINFINPFFFLTHNML